MSSTSARGSSIAAKWPPEGMRVQRCTLNARSAQRRGGLASSPGKIAQPVGTSTRDRAGELAGVHRLVVEAARGVRRLRNPVEHDVGEQLILRKAPLDVAAAIAPGAELFDDPRGEAGGRVVEGVGERLRLRPLNALVAGFLLHERAQRMRSASSSSLTPSSGGSRDLRKRDHHAQMDADRCAAWRAPRYVVTIAPQSPPCAAKRS